MSIFYNYSFSPCDSFVMKLFINLKFKTMVTVDLKNMELNELMAKEDSKQHCKATFPLLGAHGTSKIATVYFELEPGDNIGRHTDNAEEMLFILEGKVSASIGDETAELNAGNLALVPTMIPHDVKNTGETTAKVLGVFGGVNHIVASFDHGWLPEGEKVVSTAVMFEEAQTS